MQVKASYDEAKDRKFPEQVAIVIAKDAQGKHNPFTVGWIMPASGEPPMWAFCAEKGRYTLEAIRQSKAFVISFPSTGMAAATTFYGTHSGKDMDKLEVFPVKTQPASEIDSVLLSDAVFNFECLLESEHEAGDCVIVVGKVIAAHKNSDPEARRIFILNPSLRLGGVQPG